MAILCKQETAIGKQKDGQAIENTYPLKTRSRSPYDVAVSAEMGVVSLINCWARVFPTRLGKKYVQYSEPNNFIDLYDGESKTPWHRYVKRTWETFQLRYINVF